MPSDAAIAKAKELGVDIDTVEGTGVFGKVLVKDVQAAADAATADSKTVELPVIPAGKTPPTTAFWVMADWADVRVLGIGKQALSEEFGVQGSEITVTEVARTPSVATITGHVNE